MAKTKKNIQVVAVYDGACDVTDVFTELISRKINSESQRKGLPGGEAMLYNKDKVQENQQPSGLCG